LSGLICTSADIVLLLPLLLLLPVAMWLLWHLGPRLVDKT
jgi:hypothetical protein